MRGKAHSDETRAAVMAALLAGQKVPEVAEEFNIPEATIREWNKGPEFAEVRAKKGDRIADMTLGYLTSLLVSLRMQADHVSAREYVVKQPASEIAVLHGVMADKAFKLLSAIPGAATSDPAEVPPADVS